MPLFVATSPEAVRALAGAGAHPNPTNEVSAPFESTQSPHTTTALAPSYYYSSHELTHAHYHELEGWVIKVSRWFTCS